MESLLGLKAVTTVGLIEIRVLFGSFLVALPILAMILGQAEYFVFYGVAALAAGLVKTVFTIIDRCPWRDIAIGIATDFVCNRDHVNWRKPWKVILLETVSCCYHFFRIN